MSDYSFVMHQDQLPRHTLAELLEDFSAASTAFASSAVLTKETYASISHWFGNVDVSDISLDIVLAISDAERATAIRRVLNDMLTATQAASDQEISEFDAFLHLAPILDPLWRELYSLSPYAFKAFVIFSVSPDDDEVQERIARFEQMSGMTRQEIVAQAKSEPQMSAQMLSVFGLTLKDLGIPG